MWVNILHFTTLRTAYFRVLPYITQDDRKTRAPRDGFRSRFSSQTLGEHNKENCSFGTVSSRSFDGRVARRSQVTFLLCREKQLGNSPSGVWRLIQVHCLPFPPPTTPRDKRVFVLTSKIRLLFGAISPAAQRGWRKKSLRYFLGLVGLFSIRVFTIGQIMLGWSTYQYTIMKPANPPTQGQPNPRKIRLKVAFGPLFFPQQIFFSGWG